MRISNVRVLLWQENEPLPASTRTGSLRSLLPLGALVVAERQEPRVTALQAAASTAGFRLARSPVVRQALVLPHVPKRASRRRPTAS